jgi:hypothetical protein
VVTIARPGGTVLGHFTAPGQDVENAAQRGRPERVVELCGLHSDRPQLRDLFPAGSRYAGPPVLDSTL